MPTCWRRVPRHAEPPSKSASNASCARARAHELDPGVQSQRAHGIAKPRAALACRAARKRTSISQPPRPSGPCRSCGDTLVTARRIFLGATALDETLEMRALVAAHSDANPNRSGRIPRRMIRLASGSRTARQRAAEPPQTRSPRRLRSSPPIDGRRTFYVMTYRAPGNARICNDVAREAHLCPLPRRQVPARVGSDRDAVTTPRETHYGCLSLL
jgi:hypothetical protein